MLKKERVSRQQENFSSNSEFLAEIGIRHSRGVNFSTSPRPLKRGLPGMASVPNQPSEVLEASVTNELKSAVAEEWLRFLKGRLASMEEGEVEHHNVQVIGFCWPKEMLEFLSQRRVMAIMGAAKDRRELENHIYFTEKRIKMEEKLKANSILLQKIEAEKQRKSVGLSLVDKLVS